MPCFHRFKFGGVTNHVTKYVLIDIFCFIDILKAWYIVLALSLWWKCLYRFDELHYGKYAGLYMQNTFFFDSQPPLGKQLVALAAYLAGFDGRWMKSYKINYFFMHFLMIFKSIIFHYPVFCHSTSYYFEVVSLITVTLVYSFLLCWKFIYTFYNLSWKIFNLIRSYCAFVPHSNRLFLNSIFFYHISLYFWFYEYLHLSTFFFFFFSCTFVISQEASSLTVLAPHMMPLCQWRPWG